MSSGTINIGGLRDLYAGQLTDDEMAVFEGIKKRFIAVADGIAPFNLIIEDVAPKILEVARGRLNLSERKNNDAATFSDKFLEKLPSLEGGTSVPSNEERDFSLDVIALIDFAIRNGVGFGMVVNVLSHDFDDIFEYGSLERALKSGFRPKCNGYRFFDENSVTDTDIRD